MNTIVRLVGITTALILLLVVGSALGQQWLKLQSESLRAETLAAKQNQFEQLLALAKVGAPPWEDATRLDLARALGVQKISNLPSLTGNEPAAASWTFDYILPSTDSTMAPGGVRVQLAPPQAVRLLNLYQRATVVLLLLGLILLVLLGGVVILASRRMREIKEPAPAANSNEGTGLSSLARLARVSVEQGAQLEHERNERVRIQEDLNFQQVLLNRALEEKIRLGHDLHDGIIQALYATGLTLEAAKTSTATNPILAKQQLETALGTLNTTIRDVRTYILGLAPENLREQSFGDSVRSITETLGAGRAVTFDVSIDANAAAGLTEPQSTDLFQIVREAVSNGIRHGGAGQIVIRLEQNNEEIALLVQDNGTGFDPERAVRGHGLYNIQTRAERLPAIVACTSSPGGGTRIVVTLSTATATLDAR